MIRIAVPNNLDGSERQALRYISATWGYGGYLLLL